MESVNLIYKKSDLQEQLISNYFSNIELFKKDGFTLQFLCEKIYIEDGSILFDSKFELHRGISLNEISKSIFKETVALICKEEKIQSKINVSKEIVTGIIAGKISVSLNQPIEAVYPIVWAIVHFSIKVPQNIFCEKYSYLLE